MVRSAVAADESSANKDSAQRLLFPYLSPYLFALLPAHKLLFSCGYYDSSFIVTNVESNKVLQTVRQHKEVVTCLALASDVGQHWLVTGSKDCTLMVWDVQPDKSNRIVSLLGTIHGHDDMINCVAVNVALDIIVSGSDDGSMILHSLREQTYIRTIRFADPPTGGNLSLTDEVETLMSVNMLLISPEAYIIAYSTDGHILQTYSLNKLHKAGPLRSISVAERLYCMTLSEDGKVLMTGGSRSLIMLRWVRTLRLAEDATRYGLEAVIDGSSGDDSDGSVSRKPPFDSPIRSLYMTAKEEHLIVGLESGHIRILALFETG